MYNLRDFLHLGMVKRLGHKMFATLALAAILSTLFNFNVSAASKGTNYGLFPYGNEYFSKENSSAVPGLVYANEGDETETEEDSEEDVNDHNDELGGLLLFSEQPEFHFLPLSSYVGEQPQSGLICCAKKRHSYPSVFIQLENFRL